MNTAKCRGCGAEILFIKTRAGKTIPCDPESMRFFPDKDGKDLFVLPDGNTARGTRMEFQVDGASIGFISHFATCPEAESFRKPRKKDRSR